MDRIVFHLTAYRSVCCALALVGMVAAEASQGQETRSAAAHRHGTIEVEIAAEGSEIQMALYAPGADIVGFEHSPSSEADKQAVVNAREILSNPIALFGLPDAAGCVVDHASVSITTETGGSDDGDHESAHEHAHEHHDEQHTDKHDDHVDGEAHFEFIGTYHLVCAEIGAVDALKLDIFERFPNSQSLDFTVLGANGATAMTVERGQSSLAIDFGR